MRWARAKPGQGSDARGRGRSPGAAGAGAPRSAARPPRPGPGSLTGKGRGRARGARAGKPHRCAREASSAAVPQLLRRMPFRVTGAASQEQRWPAGIKSDARVNAWRGCDRRGPAAVGAASPGAEPPQLRWARLPWGPAVAGAADRCPLRQLPVRPRPATAPRSPASDPPAPSRPCSWPRPARASSLCCARSAATPQSPPTLRRPMPLLAPGLAVQAFPVTGFCSFVHLRHAAQGSCGAGIGERERDGQPRRGPLSSECTGCWEAVTCTLGWAKKRKLRRPARGGPEMGRGKLMETPIKSKGRGRLFQVRE